MLLRLPFRFAQLVPRSVVFQRPPSLATSSAVPLKSSAWKSGWTTPPLYGRMMSAYDAPPSLVASAVMPPTTIVLALLGSTATALSYQPCDAPAIVKGSVKPGALVDMAVHVAPPLTVFSRPARRPLGHPAMLAYATPPGPTPSPMRVAAGGCAAAEWLTQVLPSALVRMSPYSVRQKSPATAQNDPDESWMTWGMAPDGCLVTPLTTAGVSSEAICEFRAQVAPPSAEA